MSLLIPEIILPYKIYSSFIEQHPEWIFLYGNDYLNKGALGQCVNFVGYENCYRIPTSFKMCANAILFNDSNMEHWQIIKQEIDLVPKDGRPILPCRKIGEGFSRMKEFAPKLFEFMTAELNKIKYPNIVWSYDTN